MFLEDITINLLLIYEISLNFFYIRKESLIRGTISERMQKSSISLTAGSSGSSSVAKRPRVVVPSQNASTASSHQATLFFIFLNSMLELVLVLLLQYSWSHSAK